MSKNSNENYKILLKETKGDLSKLRNRLFLWIRRLHTVNVSVDSTNTIKISSDFLAQIDYSKNSMKMQSIDTR